MEELWNRRKEGEMKQRNQKIERWWEEGGTYTEIR